MFLDHTQRRSTVGRTPVDEWSARRRDLYLTTHTKHSQQTDIHIPGGIRTHNLSRRAAADLRLRQRGHWYRHSITEYNTKSKKERRIKKNKRKKTDVNKTEEDRNTEKQKEVRRTWLRWKESCHHISDLDEKDPFRRKQYWISEILTVANIPHNFPASK